MFYKPSGKISGLYFVYLLLSFALIVPIFSFIQAAVLRYSPFVGFTFVGVVACVFSVALLCGHGCVIKGKVRSIKVAVISAFLIGALFTCLSVVFFCALYKKRIFPGSIEELHSSLSTLPAAVESILDAGIVISRRLRLRGTLTAILWVAGYLISQIIILLHFLIEAGKPFVEEHKQWAKEIELEFSYIEDKDDFIDNMRTGDPYYVSSLPGHREVNVSYSGFELYPMEDSYCLSVQNYRAKEPDKNGRMKFEQDTLFEYLIIGKRTGDILLARQISRDRERVEAKIINKRTRRQEFFFLLRNVLVTGLFLFCIVMAYCSGQLAQVDPAQPVVLFGAASFAVFYLFCAVGSFVKEDVIVLGEGMFDEDLQSRNSTDVCCVEQKDSGPAYKIFYSLMAVLSMGFLIYILFNLIK